MIAEITRARLHDADAVSEILSGWINETEWMPKIHSDEEYRRYGKWLIEVSDVSIASLEGRIVGFLSRQGNDIQALYLASGFRGLGIGAKLLGDSKLHADTLGLWTFQMNTGAQAFYLQNGFTEDQRTDGSGNDEKLPDVHFTWLRKTND